MDIETIAPSDELKECQTTSEDDLTRDYRVPATSFFWTIQDYVDLIGSCTEAPSPYHWVTFLTMSGLLIGRNVYMRQPIPSLS